MKFSQYLQESKLPTKFEDSADATDYIFGLAHQMKSKAMTDLAKLTDHNFGTKCELKLKTAINAFDEYCNELEKAA